MVESRCVLRLIGVVISTWLRGRVSGYVYWVSLWDVQYRAEFTSLFIRYGAFVFMVHRSLFFRLIEGERVDAEQGD